jgi:hypothetical protein
MHQTMKFGGQRVVAIELKYAAVSRGRMSESQNYVPGCAEVKKDCSSGDGLQTHEERV